ncbi:PREDICTED: lysM domain receptor-like kinase 3 [Ipomoea nil]|uniref:lysM domain receptor-like kinase 3 n=1 Tax=Ipomoea nil TaxID=35883 RepID=UPI000901C449|nr:PREDICTED: lysM domain receptor-like kinase 3 [Ipomoea nil]
MSTTVGNPRPTEKLVDPWRTGQIMSDSATTSSFVINFNGDSQLSTSSSESPWRNPFSRLQENLPEQPNIFDFSEIRAATGDFSLKPFSSSSSSTSWRCTIRDRNVVVTQRKFRRPIETPELIHRVAMICRSHHSSLIPLKGVSISGDYIYFVYEFIHGVNLRDALKNPRNPNFTVLSSWMSRLQIVSDVASGIDYIHNYTGLGHEFVHNHIKGSSIIVIEPMLSAKICHFAMAELCGETAKRNVESESGIVKLKRSSSKMLKLEGTRGYMTPEFQSSGAVTQKSDVYAFGVVVLELVSGQESLKYVFDRERDEYVRTSVISAARAAVGSFGGVRGWVDKRLRDSYPVEVAEKLVRLALDCVEDDPNHRPDMGHVSGQISQMYLESQTWAENLGLPIDFTLSLGPR